ncbi:hypothetical protein AB0B45_31715 [Nonomuraea sp. NPDC049152]|uniref:hypothetical protein n=1 Tax=Nonomuraea sp. NPDC049152 TaxID=3154350 RepID=UPI0033CD014A
MMLNGQLGQRPDLRNDVDEALVSVLKVISAASRDLAVQNAMSRAYQGDLRQLAVCLEAMTSGQLVEVSAAAQLLSSAADQALVRKGL